MLRKILALFGICPKCNSCGSRMRHFDGVFWYSCPRCGNSLRVTGGKKQWHSEIFKEGKKEVRSDSHRAKICRGEDD